MHAFIRAAGRDAAGSPPPALQVRCVEEREIRSHGDPVRLFLNINTPGDLTLAARLLDGPPAPSAPP